jgi:hypothetical protein
VNCEQNILERLDAGEVVLGDGGYVFELEKRGYVKAGPWTPEAASEHPEAGTSITQIATPHLVFWFINYAILLFTDANVFFCFDAGRRHKVN